MSSLAEHDPDLVEPHPGGAYKIEDREFPWWLAGLLMIIAAMVAAILFSDEYQQAFTRVFPVPLNLIEGVAMTFYLTFGSFIVAIFMGLFIGLGRVSKKTAVSNLAALYVEFIRGIPMLVFIFTVALVLVPDFADLIDQPSRAIPMAVRGGMALSFFYAAFIAEVFRAGIQSVPSDQSQAGRALGMSDGQVMRKIVLPQAVRNMLPALGNDLISLMKDTSLVSVLAVRELTQMAKLYSGSSFRFRESFFILVVIYVVLTLGLSLMLRWYERRVAIPGY